ncbi:MAG: hypothetical protein NTY19_45250 [Planctomycetota bacterium]|nr:hypothetical protein [Planctomycetota bacterium]
MNTAALDVKKCLDGVRRQDAAAAHALVQHLYPLVLRIVRSHLPRRSTEEDLAQDVRAETIRHSAEIVLRLVGQVDRELTPEQRLAFERFKPKPSDLSNLDLLNVETRKP